MNCYVVKTTVKKDSTLSATNHPNYYICDAYYFKVLLLADWNRHIIIYMNMNFISRLIIYQTRSCCQKVLVWVRRKAQKFQRFFFLFQICGTVKLIWGITTAVNASQTKISGGNFYSAP